MTVLLFLIKLFMAQGSSLSATVRSGWSDQAGGLAIGESRRYFFDLIAGYSVNIFVLGRSEMSNAEPLDLAYMLVLRQYF